ncbi:MAG: NAD(P)-dependent oxidoreductase [Motiliproteus sp.]|nr:NAD(P)-dependent oxidoreductase [Motiliproteus sp.]MCW9053910.1 NAD(P)-dependent oxidoreductase [Motiliproteus sp.]
MTKPLKAKNTTVAFLGIGLMGLPMTNNLLLAGYQLQVWNRTRKKAEALAQDDQLKITDSVEEALEGADVIISMLENGAVVEHVLFHRQSYLASQEGTLFIDMSSISPETAIRHHDILTESGRYYLDAPVSGGTVGAAQATLSIMAGGDKNQFERAKPLFKKLGQPIHIGPVSTGQLTKLANQAIVGITIGAVSEALMLASKGGANLKAVRKALLGGFANSRILDLHGKRIIERDFLPGATSRVQLKDLTTVLSTSDQQNLNLPLTQLVCDQYQSLVDAGDEMLDHSALYLQLERLNSEQS